MFIVAPSVFGKAAPPLPTPSAHNVEGLEHIPSIKPINNLRIR